MAFVIFSPTGQDIMKLFLPVIALALFFIAACGGDEEPLDCPPGTAGDECQDCAPGAYCPGGDAPATTCPEGTWDHDQDPATPCADQTECEPGEYIAAFGSPTMDRTCENCLEGTYSDEINARMCYQWAVCEAGFFVTVEPTSTSDRQCSPCEDGWSGEENAESCVPWGSCSPGEEVAAAPTPSSDVVCVSCASGTYSDVEDADSCAEWSDCGPGEFVETAGSSESDRVCEDCAPGTYSTMPNAAQCVPHDQCPAGTEEVAPGTSDAPPECEDCSPGTFCAGGDTPAEPCPEDTWDHDQNPASECVPMTVCGDHEFVEEQGTATTDRQCQSCSAGEVSTGPNAPTCELTASCQQLLSMRPDTPSGIVSIEPAEESFDVFCDMVTDGGGWTLIAVSAQGGTEWTWNQRALWTTNRNTFGSLDDLAPSTMTFAANYKNLGLHDLHMEDVMIRWASTTGTRWSSYHDVGEGDQALGNVIQGVPVSACQLFNPGFPKTAGDGFGELQTGSALGYCGERLYFNLRDVDGNSANCGVGHRDHDAYGPSFNYRNNNGMCTDGLSGPFDEPCYTGFGPCQQTASQVGAVHNANAWTQLGLDGDDRSMLLFVR